MKLQYDEPLSKFASNFNLRRCIEEEEEDEDLLDFGEEDEEEGELGTAWHILLATS